MENFHTKNCFPNSRKFWRICKIDTLILNHHKIFFTKTLETQIENVLLTISYEYNEKKTTKNLEKLILMQVNRNTKFAKSNTNFEKKLNCENKLNFSTHLTH